MAILVIVGSIISAPSPVFGSFHNYLQSDFAESLGMLPCPIQSAPLIVCGLIDIYRHTIFCVNRRREADPRVVFGKAVRQLRLSKKLSQEELADLAQIHRTYIGDVERGTRNISLINMSRIAQALGVPLSRVISDMEQNA